MVETCVRTALEVCPRVILVVGFRGAEMRNLFDSPERVRVEENPDFRFGLFSSIQAGVQHVETDRFYVALADMPLIPPAVYSRLAGLDGCDAARPTCGGRKGHPVLLASRLIPIIRGLEPTDSMATVLAGARVRVLETEDPGVVLDLDEPGDYERLARE